MHYDYLFIFAHPDDAFLAAGGTINIVARTGSVLIVSLTDGSNGRDDVRMKRKAEMEAAAHLLNADTRILNYTDGGIFLEELNIAPIRDLLLDVDPCFIFTHSIDDMHTDHRSTSRIVNSCVHYIWTRLPKPHFLHLLFAQPIKLNFRTLQKCDVTIVNDISDVIESKIASVRCHVSQMPNLEDNLERMITLNRLFGMFKNYGYAEGFLIDSTDYSGCKVAAFEAIWR